MAAEAMPPPPPSVASERREDLKRALEAAK